MKALVRNAPRLRRLDLYRLSLAGWDGVFGSMGAVETFRTDNSSWMLALAWEWLTDIRCRVPKLRELPLP